MLGNLCATQGELRIDRFMTQKAAGLLGILALHPHRRHLREELVETLWPGVDPSVSRLRLNQAVSSLRRQFMATPSDGDIFTSDRFSIQIKPGRLETDVAEFEALTRSPSAPLAHLERAASIYRGDLLPGVDIDWIIGERARISGLYVSALDRLWRLYREEGRIDEATNVAQKLVASDPFREESHLALIRLHALRGNTGAALEQIEKMLANLNEIGVEVSDRASRIVARVRAGDVPPPPVPKPTIAGSGPVNLSVETKDSQLPARLKRLWGREAEIESLSALIVQPQPRLLTLIGPGGVGKTQLALELGRAAQTQFGEIFFVSLAEVMHLEDLGDRILRSINESPPTPSDAWSQIASLLGRKSSSLLILDNFEHLVEGSTQVQELLRHVSTLKILTTSRTPLGLDGEWLHEVAPLPVAPPGSSVEHMASYPAVQLFVDRARAARPDFALTDRNHASVQAICARLEGLPLALELAAGWALTMAPSKILEGLDARFELLKTRRRDVNVRHRSLYEAIDYGFSLLEAELRAQFAALSIFKGGFTADAVEAVLDYSSAAESITLLVERSMIQVATLEQPHEPRYTMLESLREYGATKLGSETKPLLQVRHAQYFARVAAAARMERNGPKQSEWLIRLADDHHNLVSALAWSEANDPPLALALATDLDWYWEAKGHLGKGRSYIERLLKGGGTFPAKLEANALNSLSWLAWNQGDLSTSSEVGERAFAFFEQEGNEEGLQTATYNLGVVECRRGNLRASAALLQHSRTLAEARSDASGIARATLVLGVASIMSGDFAAAKEHFRTSLRIEQELGNTMRVSFAISNLGRIALEEEDYGLASGLFERCIELAQRTGHRSHEGVVLGNLGLAYTGLGRYSEARRAFDDALKTADEGGHDYMAFRYIWGVASLATKIGDRDAPELWGIAAAIVERLPVVGTEAEEIAHDEQQLVKEEERNSAEYANARFLASTLSPAEAMRFVTAWLRKE